MKKKHLLMLLLLTIVTALAFVAQAAPQGGVCGVGVVWSFDDLTLTISGSGAMYDYSETVRPWASLKANIRSIVVDEGVTTVGAGAFAGMSAVRDVELAEGVKRIEAFAFEDCTHLKELWLPASCSFIGKDAFLNCNMLADVYYGGTIEDRFQILSDKEIPTTEDWQYTISHKAGDNLTYSFFGNILTISGIGAMDDCTENRPWNNLIDGIEYVVVEPGVTSIGKAAFTGCSKLKSVSLPEGLTAIGEGAFDGCAQLYEILLPGSLRTIGQKAFYGCVALENIDLPDGIRSIGEKAFLNCTSLKSVDLPKGLTSVDKFTFSGCSALTGVTVPEGVTIIGEEAFINCTSLARVDLPDSLDTIGLNAFNGCVLLTSIELPKNVRVVGSHSFDGCTGLMMLKLHNGVTTIGDYAFSGCTGIRYIDYVGTSEEKESIRIGHDNDALSNVEWNCRAGGTVGGLKWMITDDVLTIKVVDASGSVAIPDYTMDDNGTAPWHTYRNSIHRVVIEDGVTAIGNYAFYYLWNAVDIDIPESVTAIGKGAFRGCRSLRSIDLPEALTSISDELFMNCSDMVTIDLPSGITSIGASAFENCRDCLKSIDLPASVQTIGEKAFKDCDVLKSFTVPSGVTEIASETFSGCTSLKSIILPVSVTSIGDNAFDICISLEKVYYGGTADDKALITISGTGNNALSRDGVWAFSGTLPVSGMLGDLSWTIENGTLTVEGFGAMPDFTGARQSPWKGRSDIGAVVIGDGITYIGVYAFENCAAITRVALPESLNAIGEGAFRNCANLHSVNIPGGVATVSFKAFENCSALDTVTLSEGVTAIGENAFSGTGIRTLKLPLSLRSIGNSAFAACNALRNVMYAGSEAGFLCTVDIGEDNGSLFSSNVTWSYAIPGGRCGETLYYLINGNTLSIIGEGDMYDFVVAPWSTRAADITSVVIGNDVTSIGKNAFAGFAALTGIELPDSVATIGDSAFFGCTALPAINLEHVTAIGTHAFESCASLLSVHLSGLSVIPNYAFRNCANLTNVGLYRGLIRIGSYAFADCAKLNYVTLPNGLTSMGTHAFEACKMLASIALPEGMTSVEKSAFAGCTALATVDLPVSLTRVELKAFAGCDALATINYGGTPADKARIVVCNYNDALADATWNYGSGIDDNTCGNALTYRYEEGTLTIEGTGAMYNYSDDLKAPWYAFRDDIVKLVISEGVTTVGSEAFKGLVNLQTIELPETLKYIRSSAFNGCTGFVEIILPKSLITIGHDAFFGCTNLATVYYTGTEEDKYGITGIADSLESAEWVCAVGGVCGDYVTWKLIHGELTIEGTGAMYDYKDESYPSSRPPWNDKKESITKVTVKTGVTEIGEYALYMCRNVASITLPDTLVSIGEQAFRLCEKLESINIPYGVTNIGAYAFAGSKALTDIVLPQSVTTIGESAFRYCTALESAVLPERMTVIPKQLFKQCDKLTDVTLPKGIAVIGEEAFESCISLANITLPDGMTAIGKKAFMDCTSLEQISLSADLQTIDTNAFRNCTSLKQISLPAAVQTIGQGAFRDCTSLKTIEMYPGIRSISYDAFNGCSSLRQVIFFGTQAEKDELLNGIYSGNECLTNATWECVVGTCGDVTYKLVGSTLTIAGTGAMQDYTESAPAPWHDSRSSVRRVVIEDGVTNIGAYAFLDCNSMIEIAVPGSVHAIGAGAFKGCSAITAIDLPRGITAIADETFAGCRELRTIDIPERVTTIGASAFEDCAGFTGIMLPNDATSFGEAAFKGCTGLTSVRLPAGTNHVEKQMFSGCSALKNIILPASVTWIDDNAFYGCTQLTDVRFCDIEENKPTITEVGNDNVISATWTYNGDVSDSGTLGDISWTLANGVLLIQGDGAMPDDAESPWKDRTDIAVIVIDSGVTTIGESAFENCANVVSVSLPESLNAIGAHAFRGCTTLERIALPGNVTTFGTGAFENCRNLLNVSLPDGIDAIAPSMFSGCYSLASITLPEGVMAIGDEAFKNCFDLNTVTLPLSLADIGENAFFGCSELRHVYYGGAEVTWANVNVGEGNECLFRDKVAWHYAVGGSCGDSVSYIYNDGVLTIFGTGDMYDFAAAPWNDVKGGIVRAVVNDGVTSIGDCAFSGCTLLEDISLPNGITRIGNCAFTGCSAMSAIALPESVTTIGVSAFAGCTSIESVDIPGHATSIGNNAFANCTALKNVDIPDGVTSIGDSVFAGCTALKSVDIPAFVDSIGSYAFAGCTQLTNIELPARLTRIPDGMFAGCTSLEATDLPVNLSVIGRYAFRNCEGLDELDLPVGLTVLGEGAFKGCNWIRHIEVPEGITHLEPSVFEGCTRVESVTLHIGVTCIDFDAFKDNISLTDVYYDGTFRDKGEIVIRSGNGYLENATWHCESLIYDDVCGNDAKWKLEGGTLTVYGTGEMYDYGNARAPWYDFSEDIEMIVIKTGITYVGKNAFKGLPELRVVKMEEGLVNIGNYAFASNTKLMQITLPSTVATIDFSFDGCSELATVYYGGRSYQKDKIKTNGTGLATAEWIFAKQDSLGLYTYYRILNGELHIYGSGDTGDYISSPLEEYAGEIYEIVIDEGITRIGWNLFEGFVNVTSVTLPSTLETLGEEAFHGCTGLKEVILNDGLKTIVKRAFDNCTALETIVIPDSVETIGEKAFYGCASLKRIHLSESIKSIGDYTFYGCTALKTVSLPRSVESVGNAAFENCSALEEVAMSDNVTFIGYSAFSGCTSLGWFDLPAGLTLIEQNVFNSCTSLERIYIPASVAEVYDNAFYGCTALKRVDYGSHDDDMAAFKTMVEATTGNECLLNATWYYAIPEEETGICGENATYSFYDNVLTIGGTGPMYDYTADNLPPWHEYRKVSTVYVEQGVTEIGNHAFEGLENIRFIIAPEGMTRIGDYAFVDCHALEHASLPESLNRIGAYAFSNCFELWDIHIPSGVTEIGAGAFRYCRSLEKVTVPAGVTVLDDNTFAHCNKLESITLNEGLTSIGKNALRECEKIKTIYLPGSVAEIGDFAFAYCTRLTRVNYGGLPSQKAWIVVNYDKNEPLRDAEWIYVPQGSCGDDVTWSFDSGKLTIGGTGIMFDYTVAPWYEMAGEIKSVVVEEGVTAIGDSAFYNCSAMKSIALPSTLKIIGDYALCNCSTLTTVDIPEGVSTIGTGAFSGCAFLVRIDLPDGIGRIDAYTFENCLCLESVSIPERVTEIGESAFAGCAELKSVTLPEGITEIASNTFSGCRSLKSIVIPKHVTKIGDRAFGNCTGIETVELPVSVTTIDEYAFVGCAGLHEVNYAGTPADKDSIDVARGNDMLIAANWSCKDPEPVNDKCGDELTWAFQDGTLTIQGTGDMYSYEPGTAPWYSIRHGIESVSIESGATSIGNNAFCGCMNLTELALPKTVARIDSDAFFDTVALTNVTYAGTCTESRAIEIAIGNDKLTAAAWQYEPEGGECGDDVRWLLENGVLTIQGTGDMDDFNAGENTPPWFAARGAITSAVVENGVTGIGSYAFCDCDALTGITLPVTITAIGENAFAGCDKLSDVYYDGTTAERNAIVFAENNNALRDATWHCTDPESGSCGTDMTWTYKDGVLTIDGTGAMNDYEPGTVPWVFCQGDIETVNIASGVTSIGKNAFAGCDKLSDVYYDGTTAERNAIVFAENNDALRDATWHCTDPESGNCGTDMTWTYKDGVLTIDGTGAMNDYEPGTVPWVFCQGDIETVNIASGVTAIGKNAFAGCDKLSDVYYDGTTAQMKAIAIGEGNDPLTAAHWAFPLPEGGLGMPANLKTIKAEAFAGLNVARINVPASVTTIEAKAFDNCKDLVAIVFEGEGAISIADDAFGDSKNVTVYAKPGSGAEQWAKDNGYPVVNP